MMKLLLFVLLCPALALALISDADRQELLFTNFLAPYNSGFESGTAKWSWSSVAPVAVSSGGNLGIGKGSVTWDSTAAGQTITSTGIPVSATLGQRAMKGNNGQITCRFLVPSGTATHKLQVYDATNVLSESTIVTSTDAAGNRIWTPTPVSFIWPTSGLVYIRWISVAANEPLIAADDCQVSFPTNIGTVSQATIAGSLLIPGASGCSFGESTSSGETNFVDLGVSVAACGTNVATGSISSNGAQDYKAVYNNMPGGDYEISVTGFFYNGTAGAVCNYTLSDGTNDFGYAVAYGAASASVVSSLVGRISYTGPGSRTFKIKAADNSAGTCVIDVPNTGRPLQWTFKRFPAAPDQVASFQTTGWKVDANIYAPLVTSMGLATQSTYTPISASDLTLAVNTGSASAGIACDAGTVGNIGVYTCSSNENVGITFDVPKVQDVEVCASFSTIQNLSSGYIQTALALFETSDISATALQGGKTKLASQNNTVSSLVVPYRLCEVFPFSTSGKKTIRLMNTNAASGGVSLNSLATDRAAGNGGWDLHWEIRPVIERLPALNLVGDSAMILIATATASNSATVDFTGIQNHLYDSYEIVYDGVIPITNAVWMGMRVSTGGVFQSGGSDYSAQQYRYVSSGSAAEGYGAGTSIAVTPTGDTMVNTAGLGHSGKIRFYNPTNAARKRATFEYTGFGSQALSSVGGGQYLTGSTVDGFRFFMSSGNISAGTFKLYGIKR